MSRLPSSLNLSESEYSLLCDAVSSSVRKALSNPEQLEPQLVANLVYRIPHAINQCSIGSKYRLTCSGVFIHQTPKVTIKHFPIAKPQSVELGDLLLLLHDGDGRSRALILQAKKTAGIPVKPDNQNQHYLYALQPTFEYINSGTRLNKQKRRITGIDVYNGCKYILLRDPCKDRSTTCRWTERDGYNNGQHQPPVAWVAQPAWPELTHYRSFEHELIDFILGYAGKPYALPVHGNNKNWDCVINDLIQAVPNKFSRTMANATGGAHSKRACCFDFLSGETNSAWAWTAESCKEVLTYPSAIGNDVPPQVPNREDETSTDAPSALSIISFNWTTRRD
jgi:hypothetical protein